MPVERVADVVAALTQGIDQAPLYGALTQTLDALSEDSAVEFVVVACRASV